MPGFKPLFPVKFIQSVLPLLISMLLFTACKRGSAPETMEIPEKNTANDGYNALFIGHSFFVPIASGMPTHAARAGIEGHTQNVFFSGGSSGAPEALWRNPFQRAEIQSILNAGDVELFGMTYHPVYPGLDGYMSWVEYALAQNSQTIFFVALPWPTGPRTMDVENYKAIWTDGHTRLHSTIIDALRKAYPDNVFYCIPYGEASVELYELYEQGNLPDADTLITSGSTSGIYKDELGHAEPMLIDLCQLVWLQAIFKVDLHTYDYDPGYSTELKTIASGILERHDNAYDFKK